MRLFISLVFLAALATTANAVTINVTTLDDTLLNNGACSIREAVINANNDAATWPDCDAGSGPDVINLPAGTITLTINNLPNDAAEEQLSLTGDLDLTTSLTINGNVAGTTIDADQLDRIFDINPDTDGDPVTPVPAITVAINRLTMTNGRQNDVGAVRALFNSTVTIDSSTISNSTSWANDSGGLYNSGTLTITNSTVSGNFALLLAGGVKNEGTMTMIGCTVTNNSSSFSNLIAGVFNGSVMTMGNTIIAGNTGVDVPNLLGTVTSLGYNIVGSLGTLGFNPIPVPGAGDQVGVSDAAVQLGVLQNNGGATPTHALGVGSIAIDKGNSLTLTTDQRGEIRPCDDATIANAAGGDGADVGAFEVQGVCFADTDPPVITASVATDTLWSPNHQLVNVGFTFNVTDNSNDPISTQITVFSNEDDVFDGGESFSPDASDIATGTLRLRGERSSSGQGRVYLILIVATDSSNNVIRTCLSVVVPKGQSQPEFDTVNQLAVAARAVCEGTGAPPAGYFVVGDGPVVGPFQ